MKSYDIYRQETLRKEIVNGKSLDKPTVPEYCSNTIPVENKLSYDSFINGMTWSADQRRQAFQR